MPHSYNLRDTRERYYRQQIAELKERVLKLTARGNVAQRMADFQQKRYNEVRTDREREHWHDLYKTSHYMLQYYLIRVLAAEEDIRRFQGYLAAK